jgi:pimeloyl-ACP methyl ester carboxylesterase
MASEKKSVFKRVLIIILVVLTVHSAGSMVATKLIYDSIFARYSAETVMPDPLVSDMVQQREEMFYPCGEWLLAGYLYRCPREDARDTLVVLAPGFHAGADDYLWQIRSLLDKGWSVFAFDPVGSCESAGDSYIGFPQEILDLDATLNYIESSDRFGYSHLALLGHSRGGYAAGCVLSYGHDVDAVITVSGVNSAMEGIMGYSTAAIGPLAYGNYGFLWLYQAMLFDARTVNLQAHEQIDQSNLPALIVHGGNDKDFPMDKNSIISHREQIASKQVEYLICQTPGQDGHTDLLFDPAGGANETLMVQISDFLQKNIQEVEINGSGFDSGL